MGAGLLSALDGVAWLVAALQATGRLIHRTTSEDSESSVPGPPPGTRDVSMTSKSTRVRRQERDTMRPEVRHDAMRSVQSSRRATEGARTPVGVTPRRGVAAAPSGPLPGPQAAQHLRYHALRAHRMKMPNSRSRPRRVFSRAVRVASQVERRRCNGAMAWCSTVLTGSAESRRTGT
jgi:hypothetical protein